MPTFEIERRDLHENFIVLVEALRKDDSITDKPKAMEEMLQSLSYEDSACCDGCDEQKIPMSQRKANFPHTVESDDNGGLTATYECRNCGSTYQVGYAEEFHLLQFG